MTPYKAVREHCKYCMNGQWNEIKLCTSPDCYWYDWRYKKQPGSTIKAIRKYCLEECVGSEDPGKYERVKNCNIMDCPLRPYRMGKNPNPRKMTEEQKEKLKEQLKHARKMRST